jgi:hypothetical protein
MAEDVCTGTAERKAGRATVFVPSAGQPGDCKRAGSACRHSCLAAVVLATGMAGEARGSSSVGGCVLSSLAGKDVRAAARGLAGGRGYHRWALAARQKALRVGYAGRPAHVAGGAASYRALVGCASLVEQRLLRPRRPHRRRPSCP